MVPEGMRSAVAKAVLSECGRVDYHPQIRVALEAALRWLSENPIVPTEEQWGQCLKAYDDVGKTGWECAVLFVAEWQRRMFDAPPDPYAQKRDQIVNILRSHDYATRNGWLSEELIAALLEVCKEPVR